MNAHASAISVASYHARFGCGDVTGVATLFVAVSGTREGGVAFNGVCDALRVCVFLAIVAGTERYGCCWG